MGGFGGFSLSNAHDEGSQIAGCMTLTATATFPGRITIFVFFSMNEVDRVVFFFFIYVVVKERISDVKLSLRVHKSLSQTTSCVSGGTELLSITPGLSPPPKKCSFSAVLMQV